MTHLEQLAQKHGTDKLEHGYLPYYEQHLPTGIIELLEIGAFKGASLKMWNEYLPMESFIYTIDLFEHPENIKRDELEDLTIQTYKGSQNDVAFLSSIDNTFDVIIDDGSHNSDDQLISFRHLFLNNLIHGGGLYIIEDLHCCKEEFYHNSINRPEYFKPLSGFEDTILYSLQQWQKTGKWFNACFNEEENYNLNQSIARVEIYDEKIAFIWKK